MITLEDVLGELLGSVPDEFKAPRLLPLRLSDGKVRLPGDLPLERARVWVEGAWPTATSPSPSSSRAKPAAMPEPGETVESRPGGRNRSVENGRIASVDRRAAAAGRGRVEGEAD